MNDLKEMGPAEYAKIRKVSAVAVTRALNKDKKLIGVRHYQKVRRDWVLLVDLQEAKKNPKKCLVIPE
jgi:hypothetical protein